MAATNVHCSSIVVTVVTLLFMLLLEVINSQQLQPSFCFNMDKFVVHQPNLLFEGDASVSESGVLELTKKEKNEPVSNSVGRVLYYAPFNIWDRTTNRAKSFITRFSFLVNAPFPDKTADGIAFFIAPPFSQIPMYSNGGFLGLVSNSYNDSTRQTIAVEFDTCYNVGWDPPLFPHHIGINVNSIQSVTTVPWMIRNGVVANAIITYSANMNLLNVSLLYDETLVGHVNYTIDLKNVVSEWVTVGLSAAVGTNFNSVESHDVLSWSFHAI